MTKFLKSFSALNLLYFKIFFYCLFKNIIFCGGRENYGRFFKILLLDIYKTSKNVQKSYFTN